MKASVLLICAMIFIFFVSMDLSLTDEIGSDLKNPHLSEQQSTTTNTPSLFTIAKEKIQQTISSMDLSGEGGKRATPPASLFLLTGLFGFVFWGRASSANEHS
jgi:hypothetical protein